MWENIKRFWLFDDPRSYGARTIMREAAIGLRNVGKDVHVYQFNPNNQNANLEMRNDLINFKPDVVFLANHPSALLMNQLGIKEKFSQHFIWILDDPFMMGSESYASDDVVLVADPSFANAAQQRGANRIIFLPVAAPDNPKSNFNETFNHDVVYVGALANSSRMRSQLSVELQDYFDQIIKQKLLEPQRSFEELLKSLPLSETQVIHLTGQLAYYLYAESNGQYRVEFIKSLEGFDFGLYGNDEWKNIKSDFIHSSFKGPIDPLDEYPDLINTTKINLNLRSLQSYSVPTQRDFWVPIYNGFMISSPKYGVSNADEIMSSYFEWEGFPWSPVAHTPDEMREKVQFYLDHKDERENWTKQAKMLIQEKQTFTVRMQQLGELYDQIKNK